MRTLRFILPGMLSAAMYFSLTNLTPQAYAKPEYAKKEKKTCNFCHVNGSPKQFTDAGKYYHDHDHSLEGYKEPAPTP